MSPGVDAHRGSRVVRRPDDWGEISALVGKSRSGEVMGFGGSVAIVVAYA